MRSNCSIRVFRRGGSPSDSMRFPKWKRAQYSRSFAGSATYMVLIFPTARSTGQSPTGRAIKMLRGLLVAECFCKTWIAMMILRKLNRALGRELERGGWHGNPIRCPHARAGPQCDARPGRVVADASAAAGEHRFDQHRRAALGGGDSRPRRRGT